jgi:hypothetical protein
MRVGSAEQGQGHPGPTFPAGVNQSLQGTRIIPFREKITVDYQDPGPGGESRPIPRRILETWGNSRGAGLHIRLENTLLFKKNGPEDFRIPKNIGLGMLFFGDETVDQSHRLGSFGVVQRPYLDSCMLLEIFEYRFGKGLIQGRIDYYLVLRSLLAGRKVGGYQENAEKPMQRPDW